jgi:hypothetical protein
MSASSTIVTAAGDGSTTASAAAGSVAIDMAITATKILRIKATPLSLLVLCQDAFYHSDDHKYILPLTKASHRHVPNALTGAQRDLWTPD